jgi:hypothetical protein
MNKMNEPDFSTSYNFSILQNTDKLLPDELINKNMNNINNDNAYEKSENGSISAYLSEDVNTNTYNKSEASKSIFKNINENLNKNTSKTINYNNNIDKNVDYHNLSKEAQYLMKIDILNDMADLAKNGTVFSQNYNVNSDYDTMKYELTLHKKNKAKTRAVNWLSGLMYTIVEGLEFFSEEKFSEDYQLTGWKDRINLQIDDFNELLAQLVSKYNKDGKELPPELQFMLLFGGTAVSTILNNRKKTTHVYTPEEIQMMREKSRRDALKQTQSKQLLNKKENEQTLNKMNHYEALQKIKEDIQKQENEKNKIKEEFENNIAESPQDDFYDQRQAQLNELRKKVIQQQLQKDNSSDVLNNSNSNSKSKKNQSLYTKGGTRRKGVVMNF